MRSFLLTALFAAAAGLLLCDCQKKREPVPGPQSAAPKAAPAAPPPPATPGGHSGTDRLLRF
jgi:hypothetical protein